VRDACRLTGNAVVGRGPQEILDVIRTMTPAAFAGKHVILSSGASNNPAAAALVVAQLAEIRKRGAASITVLGVGTRGDFAGVNDMLRAAARDAGADSCRSARWPAT
jgi:hypothetical protein